MNDEVIEATKTITIYYTFECPSCKRIHHIDKELDEPFFEELEGSRYITIDYCKCGSIFSVKGVK